MPSRYITIPTPINLKDPRTGESVKGDAGVFDFETLLHKISDNPKWNTSYKLGRCMDAIWTAWETRERITEVPDLRILVLAEEDWKELEEAVQHPKQLLVTTTGPQIVAGFGFQPRLMRQILPVLESVVKASPDDPRQAVRAAE
jgi:hypothetical protein